MTVKIRLLTSRCGPDVDDKAGDEIDVDAETARRMCEESNPPLAVYAASPEKAVVKPPAKTVKPKPERPVKAKPEKAVK